MNQRTEGTMNAEFAKETQRAQSQSTEEDCSHDIIGAAIEVQRELGVGLLESAYCAALEIELTDRGLAFEREVPIEAWYKNQPLGLAYRADFVVDGKVIVEIKAIEAITDVHRAQLLSYLRVADLKLGLLINFHAAPLGTKGIARLVNRL